MSFKNPPEFTRRTALKGLAATAVVGCKSKPTNVAPAIQGKIMGNDATLGHRLRGGAFPAPTERVNRTVLIVGGGVAGLGAAWRLSRAGVNDVELVEMAPRMGGTARGGENRITAYPWGAHYVPVPNPESTLALRLYEELGLVTGRDAAGRPRFNERHLVFEPEDRLFFRGRFYDGLFLEAGADATDRAQHKAFLEYTSLLRNKRGKDGRRAFTIPTALASRDPEFTALDHITMAQFMNQKGWTSARLRWWVNYGCRDDYGAGINSVSAWAALHYFSGRRPWQTAQTEGSRYFTWPQGNEWMTQRLEKHLPASRTQVLAYDVKPEGQVQVFDAERDRTQTINAQHVILATPNHVTDKLTGGARKTFAQHAPWLVANVLLRRRPSNSGPGWNNVPFESDSLGYVDATHQRFGTRPEAVWTWFKAYALTERRTLLTKPWTELSNTVRGDLERMHGNMSELIERIDVWRWGHGTIVPTPGVIMGPGRAAAAKRWGQIRFAHTDLSGLPFFEEALYRGVLAAEDILSEMKVPHTPWAETA